MRQTYALFVIALATFICKQNKLCILRHGLLADAGITATLPA